MSTIISQINQLVTDSISLIAPIVTLDRDMIFSDEFDHKLVLSTVTPTIGGGVNVQNYERNEKGRLITLESADKQGAQQKQTVEALKAQSDIVDGIFYLQITSNSETFEKVVIFRNEIDPGPVQFKMQYNLDGLRSDTFNYNGSIFLMVSEWPES